MFPFGSIRSSFTEDDRRKPVNQSGNFVIGKRSEPSDEDFYLHYTRDHLENMEAE